jgi:hypothetical protein
MIKVEIELSLNFRLFFSRNGSLTNSIIPNIIAKIITGCTPAFPVLTAMDRTADTKPIKTKSINLRNWIITLFLHNVLI